MTPAQKLLLAYLTPEQQEQLRRFHMFSVPSTLKSPIHYHIFCGDYRANVLEAQGRTCDNQCVINTRFCIHYRTEDLPVEDEALGYKLFLESDERRFRKKAGRT